MTTWIKFRQLSKEIRSRVQARDVVEQIQFSVPDTDLEEFSKLMGGSCSYVRHLTIRNKSRDIKKYMDWLHFQHGFNKVFDAFRLKVMINVHHLVLNSSGHLLRYADVDEFKENGTLFFGILNLKTLTMVEEKNDDLDIDDLEGEPTCIRKDNHALNTFKECQIDRFKRFYAVRKSLMFYIQDYTEKITFKNYIGTRLEFDGEGIGSGHCSIIPFLEFISCLPDIKVQKATVQRLKFVDVDLQHDIDSNELFELGTDVIFLEKCTIGALSVLKLHVSKVFVHGCVFDNVGSLDLNMTKELHVQECIFRDLDKYNFRVGNLEHLYIDNHDTYSEFKTLLLQIGSSSINVQHQDYNSFRTQRNFNGFK
jgi:hypothetical protein